MTAPTLKALTRRWLWVGLCAAIFLPRAYLAIHDRGVLWSDEIFQTLEQGHRLAFGYGFVPWEFKEGARSYLLPGIIAFAMKLFAMLGITSGAALAAGVKLGFAFLAALTFYPFLRMAYAVAGIYAAMFLAVLAAIFPACFIYGSRAMAEVASAPCLAFGLWLLWPVGMGPYVARRPFIDAPSWWQHLPRLLIAGCLLGLSMLLRYQNGVLLPVILAIVALRAGLRCAVATTLGAVLVVLLGGLLDWLTWRHAFQSLIVYVRFNLVESGANQWGIAKRGYYLRFMLASNGPLVLAVAAAFIFALRRTWAVTVLALLFLAIHSFIPHKEMRFLYPVLPIFLFGSAVGLAMALGNLPYDRRGKLIAACATAGFMALVFSVRATNVRFAEIGQLMEEGAYGGPTKRTVWGGYGERNDLFSKAGQRPDLCGLSVPGMNAYWTGGYTYLHRRVPLLWSGTSGDNEAANYSIVGPGQRPIADARYRLVEKSGPYGLYRRDGGCKKPLRSSMEFGRLLPTGIPGT